MAGEGSFLPLSGSLCDVPGLRVGHFTDLEGRTGCTVVLTPDAGAVAGIDVRGGAPGTHNTDALRPGNLVDRVNAVVLTGGSAYGMATVAGAMRYLRERKVGFSYGNGLIPIVCAAVIFDLAVATGPQPDAEAGYAACQAATAKPERGSVGAGTGATVGKSLRLQSAMRGGLGMASRHAGSHVVSALAVVNAFGDVVDRGDRIVAGARRPAGGFLDAVAAMQATGTLRQEPGNTTLVAVATTASFSREQITKVAQMAQNGIARAVRPSHTMGDGDLVFALSVPAAIEGPADVNVIGTIAAEVVVDAIIDAVTSAVGDERIPAVKDL